MHPNRQSAEQILNLPDRKAEIVEATIRVIKRDGWGRATTRAIAGEIGLTTGVLWHYFGDKGDILKAALLKALEPWRVSLRQALADPEPWQALVTMFLPDDGVMQSQFSQIWPNVVSEIRQDPDLWALYRQEYGAIRDDIASLIALCQDRGLIDPRRNCHVEADRLCAVLDGLMMAVVGEPDRFPLTYVRSIIAYHFEQLRRV